MIVSQHVVVVKQPIDVVFKNLSCLKGCLNWSTLLHDTEQLDAGPAGVGTRYKHVAGFMGIQGTSIQTIRVLNPPTEFAFGDTSEQSPFPVENHYTLSETPEGTRVQLEMTLKPRGSVFGRIAANLLIGRLQKQMDSDLQNFKELVEAGVTVHAQ